jgi:dihydroorotase
MGCLFCFNNLILLIIVVSPCTLIVFSDICTLMNILIKKAKIICPNSKYHLQQKDILVSNGVISKIATNITAPSKSKIVSGKNLIASNGWMDSFAHFQDSGAEHKETLHTGAAAAANGGYTHVMLVPNTNPVVSNKVQVDYIHNTVVSSPVELFAIGAVTKNTEGKSLAEMQDMLSSGAIAFSDGLAPVQNASIMLKALQYIKRFHGVMIQMPIHEQLSKNGLIHEGKISTMLGMPGKMAEAEHIIVQRDIELLRYTDSRLHITGISSAKSVALIKQAKKEKLAITCSVALHHLLFTDEVLQDYNAVYKVNPPFRTEVDRKALLNGIADGTIDCISSHHNPQDWDAKECEFAYAEYGMSTIEHTIHVLTQLSDSKISMEKWVECLTSNPRKIFGISSATIDAQEEADLTIFSLEEESIWNTSVQKSKAYNTPFTNQKVKGKIVATILGNKTFIA